MRVEAAPAAAVLSVRPGQREVLFLHPRDDLYRDDTDGRAERRDVLEMPARARASAGVGRVWVRTFTLGAAVVMWGVKDAR